MLTLLLKLTTGTAAVLFLASWIRARRLSPLAKTLGLRVNRLPWQRALEGTVDGLPVTIDLHDGNRSSKQWITFTLHCESLLEPDFELRTEKSLLLPKNWYVEEIELGDKAFDDVAWVRGQKRHVRALLDATARTQLIPLVREGLIISRGVVKWKVRTSHTPFRTSVSTAIDEFQLTDSLRTVSALARALSLDMKTVAQRLARIATTDPERDVRINCLKLLVSDYSLAPETPAAVVLALHDENAEVRLVACRAAPNERARKVLASMACDERVAPSLRAQAIDALIFRKASEELRSLHESALGSGDASVRAAGVRALVFVGGGDTTARLVSLMKSDETEDVRIEAAYGLGVHGGRLEVETLMLFAKGAREESSRAAAHAIAQIQGRIGRVGEGNVSLDAEIEKGGAVSVSENGAVSVSKSRVH